MPDEKPNKYEPVARVPIPTYEEAIGASSTHSPAPPSPTTNETANPAEREGLLSADTSSGRTPGGPTRRAGYRPPPTEDGSLRGDDEDGEGDDEDGDETGTFLGQDDTTRQQQRRRNRDSQDEEQEVRREMEEMEYEESPPPSPLRSAWGKRIASLSSSIPWLSKLKFKPRWPSIQLNADMCILIGRLFAILLILAVVYLLFVSTLFTDAAQRMAGQMFDPESVRIHVQGMVAADKIMGHSKIISENDHLAGTQGDYFLAEYVKGVFQEFKLGKVRMEEYGVYLNYAKEGGRKVELLDAKGEVKFKAKVEEEQTYQGRQQTPVFHGHSKSGDVKGPLIYVNYGSKADYKVLYDSAILAKGAIALVRQGGTQRDVALKVKAAEDWGFVGVIVYSDPADEGFRKGEVAPKGRFMPGNAVQRGAASLTSWVMGDVLTPGWASTADAERRPVENNPALPKIPSLPISWEDAKPLLEALKGIEHTVPHGWAGGIEGVEYWIGNQTSPVVHLVNQQDEVEKQPIWNVHGRIKGLEQNEKSVIIGSPRDAWVYGASSPGSGTAVMLEMIRVFSDLMERGWHPLRTIEFVSWDAEAYNLIGSTEHVEEHIEDLRKNAYAYINLDVAVSGTEFHAAGSPVFKKSLLRALDRLSNESQNATLRHLWDERRAKIDGLGGKTSCTPYQTIAGVSSIDIGFRGPVSPAGSAYDTFEVLSTAIDPGFSQHALLAQIASFLTLEFADKLVAPFDMSAYSSSLLQWVMGLEHWVENKGVNVDGQPKWDSTPLREAAMKFARDTKMFESWETEWDVVVGGGAGFESSVLAEHRKSHNNRMANFDMHLLDLEEGGGVRAPP